MLKFMRAHATSWFIKIIIGAIIVVFVLYFGGQRQERKRFTIATVGDTYITAGEFDRAYRNALENLRENYSRIFGEQPPPDLLKGIDVKKQVLDQLIDAAAVEHYGRNMGLRVGEEELRGAILYNPAFQRGGRFDRSLYEQFVRGLGLDEEKYLALVQRDLMNQRIAALIGDTAVILSDEEEKDLYALENGKINLSFVKVSPQAFVREVSVSQDKLEQYYAEHKEEYLMPAQVKVIYLRFSPDAYRTEVRVSPQEVQEYYDMNREQYHSPARVRLRHILIRVSPDATPEVTGKARLTAEKALAEARRGASFAALARQYSDDPSASKGGDLGYFSRGEMEQSMERVVFSLRKGELGPVVRTSHGFHIVKVEDVQAGKTRGMEEVKKEIAFRLMQEKAFELAAIHAEDAAYQAKKRGGLRPYADEQGVQVREGGPFTAGAPGSQEKLPAIAFTLEAGDVSSAFQDGDDFFVLQVIDKIPPQVPSLDKVRGRVREAFIASSARELAQGAARDLLLAWRKGERFREILSRYGLRVDETGFFTRSLSSAPGIGPLGDYAATIAALTLEDPWPEDIAEVNKAFVVVKLQGVAKVDEKAYDSEKAAFRTQLTGYKGRELLEGWLTAIKQRIKIDINEELLGGYR
jgi:peptidyl-prolyl cis-trans isomerase D